MAEERILTSIEERVIRLCHHDFMGLTQQEAADKLGVSQAYIAEVLRHAKKKAPQLFPIMNRQQVVIYKLITEKGMSHEKVARRIGKSVGAVKQIVTRIRRKGFSFPRHGRKVRYESWMENQVVEKF